MDPIPDTELALAELSRFEDESLTQRFGVMASEVAGIAPECLGVTVSLLQEGLAFTWVASGVDVASLDAVQYLDHGPCLEALQQGATISTPSADPMDESTWRLFASAANAAGVHSTLSIPIVDGDAVVAGVNLYGGTPDAFDGRHEALAAVWGGWPAGAVSNADLSLSGVRRAKEAPRVLENRWTVDQAVGMLIASRQIHENDARQQLQKAAARAGVSEAELASMLVRSRIL